MSQASSETPSTRVIGNEVTVTVTSAFYRSWEDNHHAPGEHHLLPHEQFTKKSPKAHVAPPSSNNTNTTNTTNTTNITNTTTTPVVTSSTSPSTASTSSVDSSSSSSHVHESHAGDKFVLPDMHQIAHPRHVPSLLHLKGTNKKLVLGMVGLPARGKTYIAKKVARYLNWSGYKARVFNIGAYRRELFGANPGLSFFDPTNPDGVKQREECAQAALKDMMNFFQSGGHAAVYDGTNSTKARRKMVVDYLIEHRGNMDIELVWIESICHDKEIVLENIKETKLTSPDYENISPDEAASDFLNRIAQYEKSYETLEPASSPSSASSSNPNSTTTSPSPPSSPSSLDDNLCSVNPSYIKIINAGQQIQTNRIQGYLMGKICFFLINLKINRAPIYITRHGESLHNVKGLIGGDPALSPNGRKYAEALSSFVSHEQEFSEGLKNHDLSVWTSTLQRTIETSQALKALDLPTTHWRALIEIQVGTCENMTYAEIEQKYPEEFKARKRDKLHYRYPQGESYMDVINRIEPIIFELERMSTPVLLIVHRAVARCLYSYFVDLPPAEIPHLDVPLHTVIKLEPKAYGCKVTTFKLGVPNCEDHDSEK